MSEQITQEQIENLKDAYSIERQTNADLLADLGALRRQIAQQKLIIDALQRRVKALDEVKTSPTAIQPQAIEHG